jgi:hypothetical protein
MSTIRTSLIRLAAVSVSAAVVASGAAGVANAQYSLQQMIYNGVWPQVAGSVVDSIDSAPVAPASVTDSVGTVTGSLVGITTELTGSAADSVAGATSGSTEMGSLGELIGLLPGSIELTGGSGEGQVGSLAAPIGGSLFNTSVEAPQAAGSAMEVAQSVVYSPLGDLIVNAGSATPGTGSFAIPLVPAGSLGIPWDLVFSGSLVDNLGVMSTQEAVSSLGVAPGSLVGLLPVLSVAGSVIGGVALAGGVQLPALPSVELPALPGLPSGSAAAPVRPAPAQAAPAQEARVQAPGPDTNNGRG